MKCIIWKKWMVFLFFLFTLSACGGMQEKAEQESSSSFSQKKPSASITVKSLQKEKRVMSAAKSSNCFKKVSVARKKDTTSVQKAEASQQKITKQEQGPERIAPVEEPKGVSSSVDESDNTQAPESQFAQRSESMADSEPAPEPETNTSDIERSESPTDAPYYYAEYLGGSEYFFSNWDEAMSWAQSILEDTSEGNLIDANGWTGWHGGTAIYNGVNGCGIEFY